MSRDTRTTLVLLASFAVYIGVMLPLDLSLDLLEQSLLSLTTWGFLGIGLWLSPRHVRVQVITMVCVATCVEVFGSLILGAYRYRLDNLPLFVPPGHGLFYLMALRVSQLPLVERHVALVSRSVLVGATALAAAGLVSGPAPDLFGLATWAVLVPFLVAGRYAAMFAVSFVMTMALEFYGTGLGNWAWAAVVPVIGLPAGNPPACIGAGYCCMDRVARYLAPRVERQIAAIERASGHGARRGLQPAPASMRRTTRLRWPRYGSSSSSIRASSASGSPASTQATRLGSP